jgi:DNA mismatch endonuclease (patch repair protein)
MDTMSPSQRYLAMVHNRGRTKPERAFASALWQLGFRYLTSDGYRARFMTRFPGNPDIIFLGLRTLVFMDGCFWHGCRRCHDFEADCDANWQDKIETNRKRDRRVRARLRRQGWTVIRVWEHELRCKERFATTVSRVSSMLRKTDG